jgi:hypothetical protein
MLIFSFCGILPGQEIVVTSPAKDEQWKKGTTQTITWTSKGLDGKKVYINLILDSLYAIADQVPIENGSWSWSIPWEMEVSDAVSIEVKVPDGTQGKSETFAIAENKTPSLQIRAPVGNETWAPDHPYVISWESRNMTGNLLIEFLKGEDVVGIVENVPVSDIRHPYRIPKAFEPGNDYRIKISDAKEPSRHSTSGFFSIVPEPPAKKKWTVLFYFAGDNNLEGDMLDGLRDMGKLAPESNVNYVFQVDRVPGHSTDYGNWYGTKRFVLESGMTPAPENAIQVLGELNMGHADTLTDFINWAAENHPAEKYFLILSDHGSGWLGGQSESMLLSEGARSDVCTDDTNGGQEITTRAMQGALEHASTKMDILGLDTCLEGFIEVAYQIRNSGPKIFIASQYQESSSGQNESASWPYAVIFRQFNKSGGEMDGKTLAALICDEFVRKFANQSQTDTLSAIDLEKVGALTEKIADFANSMIANPSDKKTVKTHAAAVKRTLRETVIHCAGTLALVGKVNGLNINFPTQKESKAYIRYVRDVVDFAEDSNWKNFLTAYVDGMKGTWIDEARLASAGGLEADSADLYNFCNHLAPEANEVSLNILINGNGITAPQGQIFVKKGAPLDIEAFPNTDPAMPPLTHFVKWLVSGDARVQNHLSAKTTATPDGNATLIAVFYEDKKQYTVNFLAEGNGTLTGTLTQNVSSGGACSPIVAVPEEGFAFLGWGGDGEGYENPLTLQNVQMDMTVFAFFGPATEITARSLKYTFNNGKPKLDRITIRDAVYPPYSPAEIESASVTINGVAFECLAGNGWTNPKLGVYHYFSGKKTLPEIRLTIDTNRKLWSFQVSKADLNEGIVPQDNLEIVLTTNNLVAAKLNLDYTNDLYCRGTVEYKRPKP